MDLKTKKLHFVQEFLRIRDESLIDKLRDLLQLERKKLLDKEMNAPSEKELNAMIDSAEQDSEQGRLTSAQALKNEIDTWD